MMKKTFTLILISITFQLFSQEISGILFDKRTSEPLIGASVFLKGTTVGAQTDIDGRFKFKPSQQPPFTLVFSYIGYDAYEMEVKNLAQVKNQLQIRLTESESLLNAVEIVDSRITEKQKENARIEALGFKSYAPLFYGQQQPPHSYPVNAPHYIITKIHRLEEVKTWVNADEIGRKNGFVFLKERRD